MPALHQKTCSASKASVRISHLSAKVRVPGEGTKLLYQSPQCFRARVHVPGEGTKLLYQSLQCFRARMRVPGEGT